MEFFINILIALVIASVSAYFSRVKPEKPADPTLDDIEFPQAKEGVELSKVFGTKIIQSPMVAWYGDLLVLPISQKGGRKFGLFGPRDRVVVGFRHYLGVHFVLCIGPADKVRAMFADKRLLWNTSLASGRFYICQPNIFGPDDREGGIEGDGIIYQGKLNQGSLSFDLYLNTLTPPPHPGYRGVTSVVLRRMYIGNATNVRPWAFRVQRIMETDVDYNAGTQWNPTKAMILRGPNPDTDITQTLIIGLDLSGSMSGSRLENAQAAITSLLNELKQATSEIRVWNILYFGWSTLMSNYIFVEAADADGFDSVIAQVNASETTGGTSFELAYETVQTFLAPRPFCEPITFFFITDGLPTGDTPLAVQIYEESLKDRINTVGVSIDRAITSALISVTDSQIRVDGGNPAELLNVFRTLPSEFDMNPVHILREVLLSPDAAGNLLSTDLGTTWDAAAQTAFDEEFGLSFLWNTGIARGDFIAEVERHLDARVYVDRTTGKWEIKLIRSDYDIMSLPVFDDSNVSEWANVSIPEEGNLINQVVVNYTKPQFDESASLTITNVAKVRTLGGKIVQSDENYPGIHKASLAARVGERDLIAKGFPLVTGEIVLTDLPFGLNVGDPIILNNPRIGLNNVIVRLAEITEPFTDQSTVTVRFVQDKFNLSQTGFVVTEEVARPRIGYPVPATNFLLEESPAGLLIERFGLPNLQSVVSSLPDAGFLHLAVQQPNGQHIDYVYWDALLPSTVPEQQTTEPFVPVAILLSQLTNRADHTKLVLAIPSEQAQGLPGKLLVIGSEYVRVASVISFGVSAQPSDYWAPAPWLSTAGAVTLEVSRGWFDTAPSFHLAEETIWILSDFSFVDDEIRVAGDELDVWAQTVAMKGALPISQSYLGRLTFDSRLLAPAPPGRLRVDGELYAPVWHYGQTYELTWEHRHRFSSLLLPHVALGPDAVEEGVTYRVLIESVGWSGAVVETLVDENVGTGKTYTYASGVECEVGSTDDWAYVSARVIAVLDGDESRWNARLVFPVAADFGDVLGIWANALDESTVFEDVQTNVPATDGSPVGGIIDSGEGDLQ